MGNRKGCYRIKEDLEDLFVEFYLKNNFVPIASELSKHGLPSHATIKRRCGKTYNDFLKSVGLPVNKNTTKPKTREEMIDDLKNLANELGRIPITSDLVGRDDIKGKGAYAETFGSWSNALKEAGLEPVWCPVSDEELIYELQRFYTDNHRSPTTRDQLRYGWCTFSTRFGTWNKALKAAGLPINDGIYGIRTKGKDGVEYDSISEAKVADWLYERGVKYESHVPYFNSLVADFKVGEYYIEFFGLMNDHKYRRKVYLKRNLCKRRGIPLIELYEDDLDKLDEKLGFLTRKE